MHTDKKSLGIVAVVAYLLVTAASGQSFDAASVKPATSGGSIECSGGPGTADTGLWRCSNIPLGIVVSKAFRFRDYQFSTHDACCVERFDFIARVPVGTDSEQFDRMLQNLLRERFKLVFHYQQKEMPIYELTVAPNGLKMKRTASSAVQESEPWWIFSDGDSGPVGSGGQFRWKASNVSAAEIAKTLSDQLNRPVVDATRLKGTYDIDLKWVVDLNFTLSEKGKAEIREMVGELPDGGGPTLVRAVQDQLGLRLNSTKGPGEIVVIDHVEKVPTVN
jgi:uncharacterized protein (TIGR03435 family)